MIDEPQIGDLVAWHNNGDIIFGIVIEITDIDDYNYRVAWADGERDRWKYRQIMDMKQYIKDIIND